MCIRDRTYWLDGAYPVQEGNASLGSTADRQVLKDGTFVDVSMSVSYTHLDVYKRQPVPGSILGSAWLASVLHPDAYSPEDFKADVAEFYLTFYGFEADVSQL